MIFDLIHASTAYHLLQRISQSVWIRVWNMCEKSSSNALENPKMNNVNKSEAVYSELLMFCMKRFSSEVLTSSDVLLNYHGIFSIHLK